MPAKTGIVDIKNIDIFERFNHPILILQKKIIKVEQAHLS